MTCSPHEPDRVLHARWRHAGQAVPDVAPQGIRASILRLTPMSPPLKEQIIASTRNREFDYALALTLSRLTDLFGVLPGFAYSDDHDAENAYATEVRRLLRVDGTVLYGKRYFLSGMSQAESPDVVFTATCAHEFGHIVQFKHR